MLFDKALSADEVRLLYGYGKAAPIYDDAGNLTKDKDGYEYEYDYENRIVKITKDSNDIAEFAYDALSRRIEKKDVIDPNNTTRYYYNNNWQVLTETDANDTTQRWYVYGNYIDEVLRMTDSSSNDYYYVHDHLYSPAALTNSGGTVVERYEYDAYGTSHILEPNFADDPDAKSDYGNSYLFTGRRLDILDSGSLKIQYNRNRYYDPCTGRWLMHDPLRIMPNVQRPNRVVVAAEYDERLNLYQYVTSRPTVSLDPDGRRAIKCPVGCNVIRKPGYIPIPNGCGSGSTAGIVPDSFPGVNFTSCCNFHDGCYATCHKSKRSCDKELRECMKAVCRAGLAHWYSLKLLYQCYAVADVYHSAVYWLGTWAHTKAQKLGCCCSDTGQCKCDGK